MIEINLGALYKDERKVSVKGHQTKTGYVKPYTRVVKTSTQTDDEITALETYKKAASRTNDWIRDNPDRSKDVENVNYYTDREYDFINETLRESRPEDELRISLSDMGEKIESISAFLKDAPKFDGIVYRGMTFNIRGRKDYEEFMVGMTAGNECEIKPFVSTTANKDIAEGFTVDNNINVLMEIRSKRGVVLNGAAQFPKEREVLMDKNSKFKIIDVKIIDKDVRIKLEEI